MRIGFPLIMAAGILLGTCLATPAGAQPRPSDAEPLDYFPPVTNPPAAPSVPRFPAATEPFPAAAPEELPIPLPPITTYIPPPAQYRPQFPLARPAFSSSYGNSADAPPEVSPNANNRRYIYHDGRWWYFQPAGKWLYWSEGRWVEYIASRYASTPPPIHRHRGARGAGGALFRVRAVLRIEGVPRGTVVPRYGRRRRSPAAVPASTIVRHAAPGI